MPFVKIDPKYKYLCKDREGMVFVCTLRPTKTDHGWRDKGDFLVMPILMSGLWDECLFRITEDHFIKVDQWPDLAVDTPVLVSGDGNIWYPRHFKCWNGDKIEVFRDGRTCFTADPNAKETWRHWKRP